MHKPTPATTLKTDASFGIIPLRRASATVMVLLVQHIRAHGGHWAFPKGHKLAQETDQAAALRELYEETGINSVEICPLPVFTESYGYMAGRQPVSKEVRYYIGWVTTEAVTIQPSEIQNYCWLPIEEAIAKATFAQTKKILQQVIEYLLTTHERA